nr:hypothetical protein [Tanacetum cinerariifolium]
MDTLNGLKTWYLIKCRFKYRESAQDVYSKHRIIAITELQIVEWHNYKHLDWLIVRSCKSLVELEFFLEEVYKATTDQLDWNYPEGQQYPHDVLKPLRLIPNSWGLRVITFDHFINNNLEYLRGGASSQKYTTSVTKNKAADYGHIKWIEDLFYGFAINRESAQDVYSKHRIIAVTELQIVEWHNYKHLDWLTVRSDDNKLYKFKEGDFKRLCIQYIEDMLLLLVGPTNSSEVRVSTLSRFITNAEKSTGSVKSCFKYNQELEVSLEFETSEDAEKSPQQVDRQFHLSQNHEVWVLPNLG